MRNHGWLGKLAALPLAALLLAALLPAEVGELRTRFSTIPY